MMTSVPVFRSAVRMAAGIVLLTFVGCFSSGEDPLVAFERGNLLAERGQLEEAVNEYAKAAKALPEDPQILFRRGLCYERLGLSEKALDDYTACLKLAPDHRDAINNKGVVLAQLQKFEAAAEQFSHLIELQPDNVLALRNRGLCYHDLQEFELALADYDAALELAPNDVHNWFQRGNAFLEQRDYEAAVQNYSKAIECDKDFAKAWMNRGVAYFGLDNRVAGMQDLQEAQDRDSNIVIPAIDWENFRDAAEVAPVTELAVAKPVIDAGLLEWDACRAAAEAFLREQDMTNLVILEESVQHRCARIQAIKDGRLCDVYVGCRLPDSADNVTVPAISDDAGVRQMLLIVSVPSEADGEAGIYRFEEEWVPESDTTKAVLVKIPTDS